MRRIKLFVRVLPVAAILIIVAAPSWAAEPTTEQLQARVRELETRIASLETKTEQATKEKGAATESLLRDAEQQSQLLSAGGQLTAGYDKGFFIRSKDGNFSLRPGIQFQFRNVTNAITDGESDLENGFEVRRARFRFDGNVISPDLTYSFVWDTNRSGGAVTLLDAWAQYRFAPNWAVKAGQFKESFSHEKDISGFSQLAVDRSLLDALLGGSTIDRVQGVALICGGTKETALRSELSFNDGANTKNTDFLDAGTNFGASGRLEYKLFGNWADYKDFTARDTKEDLLVIGAGVHLNQKGDTDALLTTADVQWKGPKGLTLYGALHGSFTDVPGDEQRFDWGALAQAGYAINRQWEVFGRYDVTLLDSDFAGSNDTYNEFTVGVNYYLGKDGSAGHRAKVTLDLVYLPDGAPPAQTGLGILASEETEFVVRAQFQLAI